MAFNLLTFMRFHPLMYKPLERYKGLVCGAAPGTHAAIVEMICRHVNTRFGVADIGAHSGALLLRLRDAGFTDLTGTDLDTTRFALPDCKFMQLELNQSFSNEFDRKFNLITCTDVIEHLDSPRNFLEEARNLLEDDGFLALSMPNVASFEGRCKFLLKGELWGFGKDNYRWQRHISPLTFEMLEMVARETGYRVVEIGTAGSFATNLRKIVTFPIWSVLRLIGGSSTSGSCLICILQRAEPESELKTPSHYKARWQGVPDNIGLENN
jgi:SAM-dependent methyltransferase